MEEVEIASIKHKTTVSVVFLSLRNIGIQAISTVGFFLLTILLGAGEVGLFAIVAESVAILGYFSDVGLASALIQKKQSITIPELRTTFLIQQVLVLIALAAVALIYPNISQSKGYGLAEMSILVSLCYAFFVASLKTIPSVQLERKLDFKLLSTIDIIENTSFYFFAVLFALMGYGVYSYAFATIIRSTLGLILIYRFSPWPIGIGFSIEATRGLFKYGIPFQLNSLIAMTKDRLSSLLVAGIIGRESFGILSWAQKGPRIPLSFMDAIMRVTFPTFSRIQDEKELLKRSVEKSLYYISLFIFPSLAGIAMIAPDIINVIPRYTKWSPAVIPLYFFAFSFAIAAVTTPLTNAFNAIGKITITTKLMIMWTVLTWIFYPILSLKYDYIGTSIAAAIVGSSSFIVWYIADKLLSIQTLKTISQPLISSLLMIVILTSINFLHLSPLFNIILKIVTGTTFYLIYSYLFSRKEISWFLEQIKCLLIKK